MPLRRLLTILVILTPLTAAAEAGRFLMTIGDVTLIRGSTQRPAANGAQVEPGDTISVGPRSNAQVRMTDESIMSLRPGTVLRIDEYQYGPQSSGQEKSFFSLLKGGLRTITGAIGRLHSRDRYAVKTPTATVGIRGTHYTLVHCDNDCAPAQVSLAAVSLAQADSGTPGLGGGPSGTFGAVTDGRIEVFNDAGQREFGANEYFQVASQNALPQGLIAPPSFLYDRLEGQQRSRGSQGSETSETMSHSGLNAESRPSEVPPAPAPNPFIVTEQRNPDGTPTVLGATVLYDNVYPVSTNLGFMSAEYNTSSGSHNATNSIFSGMGIVTDEQGIKAVTSGGSPAYDRGTAKTFEPGADGGVIAWGRWADGQATLFGWGLQTLTADQGFHFLVGELPASLPREVVAYQYLGATTPTETRSGALGGWSVTGGSLSADFINGSLTGTMGLGLNRTAEQGVFSMSLSGSATQFGFVNTSVLKTSGTTLLCTSACTGNGTVFFAGSTASHAGLIYEFNTGAYFVQGAAAFKR